MRIARVKRVASCGAPAILAIVAVASPAGAQSASPRVQAAAAEYDAGRRAYIEKRYEEAAVHFENAWNDVPRAEALRNAIRSRLDAKQPARAATLALAGERVYADDPTTMALVRSTLETSAPSLHRVDVSCTPACGLALDGRAVAIASSETFAFFVEPGSHELVASWGEGRAKTSTLTASAGTSQALSLDAPPPPPSPPRPPLVDTWRESPRPLGPAFFVVGAGLTALALGGTIVSGVAAANDPGTDAVIRDCVGLGESCPTYQRGLDAQLRTNVLIGTTVLLGVASAVIGLFFTRWTSAPPVRKAAR